MENKPRPLFALNWIVVPMLCLALMLGVTAALSSCSGGASANGGTDTSAQADTSFLTDGTWECTGVVSPSDGEVHELQDVTNVVYMCINFYEDECRISVDTNFTIVNWELLGDDVTLSGDDTYHLTVQDDGAKLVWKDFQGTGYDLEFAKK